MDLCKYFFDVDGTLTPSRQPIDDSFHDWFLSFCNEHEVYLVTGSDYNKTYEQLGKSICESVKRVYCCSGNQVLERGIIKRTNQWGLPKMPHEWLSEQLCESNFPLRTGNHFEHSYGTCNFSVVGRNATTAERNQYIEWDNKTNERINIANEFNLLFPVIEARAGGETGLDIVPKGFDKSQVVKDFDETDHLIFFGDRTDEGGNDYPLAKVIRERDNGQVIQVDGWQDCYAQLIKIINGDT